MTFFDQIEAEDELFKAQEENKRLRAERDALREILGRVMEWYDDGIEWGHYRGALMGETHLDALRAGDDAHAALDARAGEVEDDGE